MRFGAFEFPERMLDYMAPGDRALALLRAERYPARMEREWATIAPHVPRSMGDVIDIGCGLGGIDIMIARNCRFSIINLVDGSGEIAKRQIGFHDDTQAWADVKIAEQFALANIGDNDRVMTWAPDELDRMEGAELVISLRSWGHHYPVIEYSGIVHDLLPRGGRVILDIRRNTNGRAQMEAAGFRFVAIAEEGRKHQRMVFER